MGYASQEKLELERAVRELRSINAGIRRPPTVSTAALVAVVAGPIYAGLWRDHDVHGNALRSKEYSRRMAVEEAFELVREAQRVVESADEEYESDE